MATKKRKRTTTRRRSIGIKGRVQLGARRRKRTTRRRKSGLSEMFSPSTATAAARSLGAAAVGGILAAQVSRMLAKQPTYTRVTASVIASFLTYAVGGYPSMAAGMAGAFAATESEPMMAKMLNDGNEYDYADAGALNEMPVYLNEDGEAIYLNEDGGYSLAEDIYLNEDEASIYPGYATEY
jgi:hypothetical protein